MKKCLFLFIAILCGPKDSHGRLVHSEPATYNVTAYGVSTSNANNIAPLMALLATVPDGSVILFPGTGNYDFGSVVTINKPMALTGQGATIRITDNTANTILINSTSNVKISGLKFSVLGPLGVSTGKSHIFIQRSKGILVENCEFTRQNYSSILASGISKAICENITISNCQFLEGTNQISSDNTADIWIKEYCEGIRINSTRHTSKSNIAIDVLSTTGIVRDVVINNAYVDTYSTYGLVAYGAGVLDLTVLNSTVKNINGVNISGNSGAGIYTASVNRVHIDNCKISNTNLGTTAFTLVPAGIGINADANANDITITNNHIFSTVKRGIQITGATAANVTISNNLIENTADQSIRVYNCGDASVTNNKIVQRNAANSLYIELSRIKNSGNTIQSNQKQHVYYVVNSSGSISSENIVTDSNTAFNVLFIQNSADILVQGCNVKTAGTSYPIFLSNCTNAIVTDNILEAKSSANYAFFAASGSKNVFRNNTIKVGRLGCNTGTICEIASTIAPTVGLFSVGSTVTNQSPKGLRTAAGSEYIIVGWKCVAAGSPGTWLPMRSPTGN